MSPRQPHNRTDRGHEPEPEPEIDPDRQWALIEHIALKLMKKVAAEREARLHGSRKGRC